MSLLSRLAVQAARAYGILSSNPNNVPVSYLVVAGGGGGGGEQETPAGAGGGAGGYQTSTATLSTLNTYSITVGAGGAGGVGRLRGTSGFNSVLSGTGITTVTSTGGGGGGAFATSNVNGGNGGSGGGAAWGGGGGSVGGTGTVGQGNNGGNNPTSGNNQGGGGGGGASAVGDNSGANENGAAGGAGTASSISGSSVTYAGGGGGGGGYGTSGGSGGSGGAGGGGAGGNAVADGSTGTAGTANTGGGGGGAGGDNTSPYVSKNGGAGGSGIVIISYTSATPRFVGGTLTTSGGNQIHTFTSSGTLSPLTPVTASYLVVAGGGAGGAGVGGVAGGGGGAGGYKASSTTLYSGATYVVTVGAGGAGTTVVVGAAGSNSSVSGTGLTTITSTGGGYGAVTGVSGGSGGSGGGGAYNGTSGGTGTSGQGNNGGSGSTSASSGSGGGGGGGASAAGSNGSGTVGGAAGAGTASSISGSSITYAGGGGGSGITNGSGGSGGGAAGNWNDIGINGTPNLGGGGGGGGNGFVGGSGGSGVVIISYAGSQVFNGGLVTSSGGNTIHTFNATGALTPLTNNLTNSLRFRGSNSAYLNRTPTVAGNRKTWTWSAWVKRGTLGVRQTMFAASLDGNNENWISFQSDDTLNFYNYESSTQYIITSSQVFRDPSAWYHIVVAFDTPQATAANRIKIYINGSQVTAFSTATYPSQNFDGRINNTVAHALGRSSSAFPNYFDGYLTDINFIDGQALEPYYFGNNDANGVWKPIKYTGMYGTNGFYLNFADTSALTTSTNAGLGKDTSGNGNFFATNNISITAGTTYDAMLDVPTNTSATVANYAVLNPLDNTAVLSEANLKITYTGAVTWHAARGSIYVSSGKWYWEVNVVQVGYLMIGVASPSFSLDNTYGTNTYNWTYFQPNGNKYGPGIGGAGSAYGASYTAGDVIGVALDMDAGTLTFYKNNTSQGTAFTGITGLVAPVIALNNETGSGGIAAINFGQRPLSYSAPSGYVALNTFNLPTPTILQGNKYMDATLYTGRGVTNVVVNQAQFKPDFVWIKDRTSANYHGLFDSIRGAGYALYSNGTFTESAFNAQTLQSFNSNGMTVGSNGDFNTNTNSYVGWQWQAGQGSTSSNTSGSITSTVSVNTTAGFSVVTYTSQASGTATFGHGLGVAPSMIFLKGRNVAGGWYVYHSALGGTKYLALQSTGAATTASDGWNNTNPTSTVVSVGNGYAGSYNMVAYCWAEIAGFSRFGSYTGNGSTDGPFVYTGFRPKFLMFKTTTIIGHWVIVDTSRNTYNVIDNSLYPDTSGSEINTITDVDFLSNGFKWRGVLANETNVSGQVYIYMAFAENPFKNSLAR